MSIFNPKSPSETSKTNLKAQSPLASGYTNVSDTPAPADIMSDQASNAFNRDFAVPSDPALISGYASRIRRRLCLLALYLTNDPPRRFARSLTPEEYAETDKIVEALSTITDMKPALATTLKVKELLQILNGTATNTKWEFPAPFPTIATDALEKYERENWGAAEQTPTEIEAAAGHLAAGNRSRPRANNQPNPISRQPPTNHPIYGTSGIMRGILVDNTGRGVRRRLDPSFPAHDSKVFGHNGLSIGQWWPFQICALRDGAHGASVAGIAGGENEGAYSIVVSGTYSSNNPLNLPPPGKTPIICHRRRIRKI